VLEKVWNIFITYTTPNTKLHIYNKENDANGTSVQINQISANLTVP